MTNALCLLRRSLPLVLLLASAHAAPANIDPRLGEPFEKRDRPSLGSDQAPIVVVEFGSYKCSHCWEFHQHVFPELRKIYVEAGKVQWFMVPTSDNSADQSGQIFLIGRCVAAQKKFWDQLEFLMTISNRPPSFLHDLVAKNSAIDVGELDFCLQQRETRATVIKDFDDYHALKIVGTPTFVIRKLRADGSRTETIVRGYHDADYFARIFDELTKAP